MKKKLLLSMVAAAVLSSSISVCAAPQYMADGAIFDPAWYQEQNPEVAETLEALGLGVSADTLYLHYTLFGANEGRAPYDKGHLDLASVLPYQSTGADPAAAQTAAAQTQTNDSEKIFAVEGETYRFPSIHSENYNYADCMVNIMFYKYDMDEEDYVPYDLTDYTVPGYEWITIEGEATTDAPVPGTTLLDIDFSKGDFLRSRTYIYDNNTITNWNSIWETLPEYDLMTHVATFTVSHNGIEYPECKLFETAGGVNDDCLFAWYALVPKGFKFNGGLSVGYRGATLENGKAVPDKSYPAILFRF